MAIISATRAVETDDVIETGAVEIRPELDGRISPGDSEDQEIENSRSVKTDPLYKRIRKAFLWRNDWRTMGGISRSAGLSEREISGFINAHPHLFVRSPIRIGGKTLFGLRHKTG